MQFLKNEFKFIIWNSKYKNNIFIKIFKHKNKSFNNGKNINK